jgi:hypothetical protein
MDGEDQLDRTCEKWRSITQSQGREEYPTYSKKEGSLTGLVTSYVGTALWNTLLKARGKDRSDGRRGRSRKQLQHDFKETRGYCNVKEEALDHTLWGTRFGRGQGPVVRQTLLLLSSSSSSSSSLYEASHSMTSRWQTLFRFKTERYQVPMAWTWLPRSMLSTISIVLLRLDYCTICRVAVLFFGSEIIKHAEKEASHSSVFANFFLSWTFSICSFLISF